MLFRSLFLSANSARGWRKGERTWTNILLDEVVRVEQVRNSIQVRAPCLAVVEHCGRDDQDRRVDEHREPCGAVDGAGRAGEAGRPQGSTGAALLLPISRTLYIHSSRCTLPPPPIASTDLSSLQHTPVTRQLLVLPPSFTRRASKRTHPSSSHPPTTACPPPPWATERTAPPIRE